MKKTVLDPIAGGFVNAEGDFFDADSDVADDAPDSFCKFLADAHFAGAFGRHGYQFLETFRGETADINKRAAQIMGRPGSIGKTMQTEPEPEVDDLDSDLAKGYTESGRVRRLVSLRRWVKSCLARGESVSDLVKHAQQYDADEAALIAEAAAGLE
jgi:hypothetical protein